MVECVSVYHRCVDNPRHHGGISSRLAQQSLSSCITGSFTAQVTLFVSVTTEL